MRTKRESIKRLRSLSREQLHKLSEEVIIHDTNKTKLEYKIFGFMVGFTILIFLTTYTIILW